ncbi:MAG: hypothetical protein LIO93_10395 [Bacteroidales bacterium]|nr:hypothetical protein [Bacteroidales bacterium]
MFKKFLSILLIFTVNILFLSHAVISHHHHDGMPHFIFLNTEHADHQVPSGNNDCCCTHDSSKKEEGNCQLDKNIDVVCETEKDYHSITCCNSPDHSGLLYQAILLYYSFNLSVFDDNDQNKIPPYLISYSSVDVNLIHGLRAPPVV